MPELKPLGTKILARLPKIEQTTKSGIVVPDSVQRDDAPILEIIAVGPGVIEDLKPGVKVVAKEIDIALKYNDDVLIDEADVLGIVE